MRVLVQEEDRDKMQRSLDLLVKRADKWGVVFNMEKCKVMHVGRHNTLANTM